MGLTGGAGLSSSMSVFHVSFSLRNLSSSAYSTASSLPNSVIGLVGCDDNEHLQISESLHARRSHQHE
jgi:hypothetical protein